MGIPVIGGDRCLNIYRNRACALAAWSTKAGKIIEQIIDLGIERSRIVVLAGHFDLTGPAEGIVFVFYLQLFNLQLGRLQIQLGAETVDCCFEKSQSRPFNYQVSAELSCPRVQCSFDDEFTSEIAGFRTE